MRHNNLNGFQDIGDKVWRLNVNQLVLKEDSDAHEIYLASTDYRRGETRKVEYTDASGDRWYMELVPYVHPTGAAAITLGTISYATDGVATYTPTLEGRILLEDGTLAGVGEVMEDVAGVLLTDYYTHVTDNASQREHFRVTQITEGDMLWLVRKGRIQLDYDGVGGALVAGDHLVTAASGKVAKSTALAATVAGIQQNICAKGMKMVATTTGVVAAAGQVDCDIDLPGLYG